MPKADVAGNPPSRVRNRASKHRCPCSCSNPPHDMRRLRRADRDPALGQRVLPQGVGRHARAVVAGERVPADPGLARPHLRARHADHHPAAVRRIDVGCALLEPDRRAERGRGCGGEQSPGASTIGLVVIRPQPPRGFADNTAAVGRARRTGPPGPPGAIELNGERYRTSTSMVPLRAG